MTIVNKMGSKIVFGIFNAFFLLAWVIILFTRTRSDIVWFGLCFGAIFLLVSGIVFYVSKKEKEEDKDDTENGPDEYMAFMIANGAMMIISLFVLITFLFD